MFKASLFFISALFLPSISASFSYGDDMEVQGQHSSAEQVVYILPPKFEKNDRSAHALSECQLEEPFKKGLVKEFEAEKYQVKFLDSYDSAQPVESALEISFEKIQPHVMSGLTFRPGSRATFIARQYNNGQPGWSYSRPISTGVRLGACERLEDIVEASVEYAVPWYIKTKSKSAPPAIDILAEAKNSTRYKIDKNWSKYDSKYDLTVNYEAIAVDIVNVSDQEVLDVIKFVDHHDFYFPEVYLAIESRLMSYFPFDGVDGYTTKMINHLCKRLAYSGSPDAFETLEKISLESENKKIKKYAGKLLKKYRE